MLRKKAAQLASLTAAGAGALVLTSGKADAGIIDSGILNTPINFQSNSNPGGFAQVGSVAFHSLAGGPSLAIRLYSLAFSHNNYDRFANEAISGGSIGRAGQNPRVAPGATWNTAVTNGSFYGRLADRQWGVASTTHGRPSVTDAYSLFRFTGGSGSEYGWLEFSLSVTARADSSSAAEGPNVTLVQYAFDDTGATIAAGDTGVSIPEPSSLAESGLAALILGAAGLRRWRKTHTATRPVCR